MGECICSSCRNLKAVIDDNGAADIYECEFGFPSEACDECTVDPDACECELTCSHYESDEQDELTETVLCSGCGKELSLACDDGRDGEVYCFDCYMKMSQG